MGYMLVNGRLLSKGQTQTNDGQGYLTEGTLFSPISAGYHLEVLIAITLHNRVYDILLKLETT